MESGDHPTAERHYTDALLAAVGSGHAAVAAVASSKQLFLRASPLNQLQQARAEVPLATAATAAWPEPTAASSASV